MSELNKTTVFLVAAVAAIGLALFTRPSVEEYNVEELRGKQLVSDFPSDAPKRLEITTKNKETGDVETFEVAESNGTWTIPSKSGYPADANEQMAAAVEGVVGREILDVVNAKSGDHATFGVVDPDDPAADDGFGTHVQLFDDAEKVLADVIIGNKVKDQEGQYYVRKAKQDVVYTAMLDLDKFSTDFSSWIEKDLLGLSEFDVSEVSIDDYTIETKLMLTQRGLEQGIEEDRRARMKLKYNDKDSKWEAVSLERYDTDAKEYQPFTLADEQELNADALRELKNALDDLEIVDVEKKPDGLSADLKAGDDFIKSRETVESLARRGFLPLRDPDNPDGGIVLLSSEGEIVITLNDGVEYVMRFGDLQVDTSKQSEQPEADADAEEMADADGEGLNRYLFVMARFNESAIPKPELEAVPDLPPEQPATEGEEAAEGEDAEAKKEDDAKPSREEIEAERARIEQNNKRAEEAYNEKIEAGKKRVEELNARFGDWYYVIPNDVFKKIHLGRDQIVKSTAAEEGAAANPNASDFGVPGDAIPGLPSIKDSEPSPPAESTEPPMAEESTEAAEPAEAADSTDPAESAEAAAPSETTETPPAAEPTDTPAEGESAESNPPEGA